ncbi:Glutaminase/Asparaginase [Gracilaria domingensis]|nr:Glutaminase/Asparaginase [Gracilaria domingensis]
MPAAFVSSFVALQPSPSAFNSRRSTRRFPQTVTTSVAGHASHGSNGVAKQSNWHHPTERLSAPNAPSNPSPEHEQSATSEFLNLSSAPGINHINTQSANAAKRPAPRKASPQSPTSSHICLFDSSNQNGVAPADQHATSFSAIPPAERIPASQFVAIPSYSRPPLPRVLIIHCGGTFGMQQSTTQTSTTLKPAAFLADLQEAFPELNEIARLDVSTPMNLDSTRMGPDHWIRIAKLLDKHRDKYDGFVIIHGTDTMSYTGAALSLMLAGFRKPVVLTGSQRPMLMPRSDARQNLVDAVTVACRPKLQEFAVCFGGLLLRANRAMKYSSSAYRAFSSPTHPPLAVLGVDIEWNQFALWKDPGVYRPRLKLDPNVIRIPVVPGANPKMSYGDLYGRGVRGAVIESFGVGNVPDHRGAGWMGWLRTQQKRGLKIYLSTQCATGPLNPNLYNSGAAGALGATSKKRMTTETAVVKMMLCLAHPDLHLSYPLAGEL